MINTINTDVHTAETALDTALAAHQAIPARLPLAEVNPGQQVLDTESRVARGDLHPRAPTERSVTVSRHSALLIAILRRPRTSAPIASVRTARGRV